MNWKLVTRRSRDTFVLLSRGGNGGGSAVRGRAWSWSQWWYVLGHGPPNLPSPAVLAPGQFCGMLRAPLLVAWPSPSLWSSQTDPSADPSGLPTDPSTES